MLIVEPEPPLIRWSTLSEDTLQQTAGEFDPGGPLPLPLTQALQSATSMGYVLRHGGPELGNSVTRLTPEMLSRLEPCVRFMPAANRLTLDIARFGLARRPQAVHYLFCETAFFAHLPAVASYYGLPHEFYGEGLRRYGGDGLCHQWVWRQTTSQLGPGVHRVVSLHLGDYPSVAALCNGQPIETSMGFSPVEGLPSATGCGDLDPTIVLFLRSTGLSCEEISRLLTQQSGFGALMGHSARWADVLAEDSSAAEAVRSLLRAALVKAVGMSLAALGGADVLVFAAEDRQSLTHPFVLEVCRELEFLGLDQRSDANNRDRLRVNPSASSQPPIKILELYCERTAMLAAHASSDNETAIV